MANHPQRIVSRSFSAPVAAPAWQIYRGLPLHQIQYLSNRRPAASILALSQTEQVARRLSLCWGVTAVVLPEASWAERVLARGVEWAQSHGIVTSGQHAVLLSGQVAERADVWAVLAGPVT